MRTHTLDVLEIVTEILANQARLARMAGMDTAPGLVEASVLVRDLMHRMEGRTLGHPADDVILGSVVIADREVIQ